MWNAGPRIGCWGSKRSRGGDQGRACVGRRGCKSKTFRKSDTFWNFYKINLNQVRALERDRQKKDNHNISELYLQNTYTYENWEYIHIRTRYKHSLQQIFLGHMMSGTLKEGEWVNDMSKNSSIRRVPSEESTFCSLRLKVPVCFSSNYFTIITFGLFWSCSVERRRRFNINDRIKELGGLLPAQVTSDQWFGDR